MIKNGLAGLKSMKTKSSSILILFVLFVTFIVPFFLATYLFDTLDKASGYYSTQQEEIP